MIIIIFMIITLNHACLISGGLFRQAGLLLCEVVLDLIKGETQVSLHFLPLSFRLPTRYLLVEFNRIHALLVYVVFHFER